MITGYVIFTILFIGGVVFYIKESKGLKKD